MDVPKSIVNRPNHADLPSPTPKSQLHAIHLTQQGWEVAQMQAKERYETQRHYAVPIATLYLHITEQAAFQSFLEHYPCLAFDSARSVVLAFDGVMDFSTMKTFPERPIYASPHQLEHVVLLSTTSSLASFRDCVVNPLLSTTPSAMWQRFSGFKSLSILTNCHNIAQVTAF